MKYLAGLFLFLFCNLLSAQEYKKGAYYDLSKNRIEGYINRNFFNLIGGTNVLFHFKEDSIGEKKKITKDEVLSYVVESDSFAIVSEVNINATIYVDQDFAKVLEVGKINLYSHRLTVQSSVKGLAGTPVNFSPSYGVETTIIEKDGTFYRMSRNKDIKESLPNLVSDCEVVFNAVNANQNYNRETLHQWIKTYNSFFSGHEFKPQLPVCEIYVYRRYKKNFNEKLDVILNDSVKINLASNSYYMFDLHANSNPAHLSMSNGSNLHIAPADNECTKYVKCSFDKKTDQYVLELTSIDEGEFDLYLIDKYLKKQGKN